MQPDSVQLIAQLTAGLNENFGLVPIPDTIRYQLLLLGCGAVGFNYFWENFLRAVFPARIPPEKGYMAHTKELEAAKALAKKRN